MATVRFIVLADRRSGSHLLQSALDQHPEVRCRRELLLPIRTRGEADARRYVQERLFASDATATGFILHREHWRTSFQREVWQELAADPGLRVIDLRRRDFLRRLVSERVLRLWKYAGESEPVIRLDVADAVADFRMIADGWLLAASMFASQQVLRVDYETDLVEKWNGTMSLVQDFLGVPRRIIEPVTKPSPHQDLRILIKNYAELAAGLRATRWEHLIATERDS